MRPAEWGDSSSWMSSDREACCRRGASVPAFHDGLSDVTCPGTQHDIGVWKGGHNDPHGANTWSSYWYNGRIFTNDSGRGIDVLNLADGVRAGAQRLRHSNPQTQDASLR